MTSARRNRVNASLTFSPTISCMFPPREHGFLCWGPAGAVTPGDIPCPEPPHGERRHPESWWGRGEVAVGSSTRARRDGGRWGHGGEIWARERRWREREKLEETREWILWVMLAGGKQVRSQLGMEGGGQFSASSHPNDCKINVGTGCIVICWVICALGEERKE